MPREMTPAQRATTFQKAKGGYNPGGFTKEMRDYRNAIVKRIADRGDDIVDAMIGLALDETVDPNVRQRAGSDLLDRVIGKPKQIVEGSEDGAPVRYEIVWGGVQRTIDHDEDGSAL